MSMSSDYVRVHCRRDFAAVIKGLEVEGHPGLSEWVRCDHRVLVHERGRKLIEYFNINSNEKTIFLKRETEKELRGWKQSQSDEMLDSTAVSRGPRAASSSPWSPHQGA